MSAALRKLERSWCFNLGDLGTEVSSMVFDHGNKRGQLYSRRCRLYLPSRPSWERLVVCGIPVTGCSGRLQTRLQNGTTVFNQEEERDGGFCLLWPLFKFFGNIRPYLQDIYISLGIQEVIWRRLQGSQGRTPSEILPSRDCSGNRAASVAKPSYRGTTLRIEVT